jgi:hypothetical protein
MANPTTNYGFVLPTSSDLVTDLPADFDIALQGVDTRLKALNPETTLGDISYASATANTNTRRAIGTTGQVLTVSGGVPVWATPAAASLPAFSAYGSSNQTPTVNVWTKVTLNTEDFDTASNFDTSTSRFTPTTAGYYQINGGLEIGTSTSSAQLVAIYKNGTIHKYVSAFVNAQAPTISVGSVVYFNGTTDYVELYGRGTAGTITFYAGSTGTWFNGVGVRA